MLTVLETFTKQTKGERTRTYCKCRCDCGNIVSVTKDRLKQKNYFKSCGCGRKEYVKITYAKNNGLDVHKSNALHVDGEKFGRLEVLETYWDKDPVTVKCKCDCGTIKEYIKAEVTSGGTKSCGCLQKELTGLRNVKDWTGYVSDYGVKLIKQHSKNQNGVWLWDCECPVCNKIFHELPANIASGKQTSCGCRRRSSREKLIEDYLKEQKIEFETEYSFDDCTYKNKLRFDFALLNNGEVFYLVEYDGQQHERPIELFGGEEAFRRAKIRDEIKNTYCKDNDIPLLRLNYKLKADEIKEKIANIIYP